MANSIQLFIITIVLLSIGCNTNHHTNSTRATVVNYQTEIDSILNYIDDNVLALQAEAVFTDHNGEDTFNIARESIPYKKVHFLVSYSHDMLTDALDKYDNGAMNEKKLAYVLDERKKYIDSLLWVHRIDYDF